MSLGLRRSQFQISLFRYNVSTLISPRRIHLYLPTRRDEIADWTDSRPAARNRQVRDNFTERDLYSGGGFKRGPVSRVPRRKLHEVANEHGVIRKLVAPPGMIGPAKNSRANETARRRDRRRKAGMQTRREQVDERERKRGREIRFYPGALPTGFRRVCETGKSSPELDRRLFPVVTKPTRVRAYAAVIKLQRAQLRRRRRTGQSETTALFRI